MLAIKAFQKSFYKFALASKAFTKNANFVVVIGRKIVGPPRVARSNHHIWDRVKLGAFFEKNSNMIRFNFESQDGKALAWVGGYDQDRAELVVNETGNEKRAYVLLTAADIDELVYILSNAKKVILKK